MTDDLLRGDIAASNELDDGAAEFAEAVVSGTGSARLTGQAGETLEVNRPAPGQVTEIQAAAGQTYVLGFPPGEARVLVEDNDFVLTFYDNGDGTADSRIVFLNLVQVAKGAGAPIFQIAGVSIGSDVLVGQAIALGGEGASPLDDVAAGSGALGGGVSEYSDDFGDSLGLLSAQGVIAPVQLQFGGFNIAADPLLPDFPPPSMLINEIGVGATLAVPGLPGDPPAPLAEYNFMELLNTSGGPTSSGDLTIQILNPAGALVTFAVPGGLSIPANGFLVIYQPADDSGTPGVEDVFLRVFDAAGNVVGGLDIGDATFWALGADTTEAIAVNLVYRLGEDLGGNQSVDSFAANITQAQLAALTNADFAGDPAGFGAALAGLNFETFNGLLTGGQHVFSRVNLDDTDSQVGWTTNNLPTDGVLNFTDPAAVVDPNPSDPLHDDLNPGQINADPLAGQTFLAGGAGDDLLEGFGGPDFLLGGAGNDSLYGGSQANYLDPGPFFFDHNDFLYGDAGDDAIYGGSGGDALLGGLGGDHLEAGTGDDLAYGDEGADLIYGGQPGAAPDGDDTLYGGADNDTVFGDNGGVQPSGSDLIYGDDGDDSIIADDLGGGGNDSVYGGSGNDSVYGGGADDTIYGGADSDLLYGNAASDLVYGDDGDGLGSADTLYGGLGNDRLFGEGGDDLVYGDDLAPDPDGDDTLDGGAGNDTLYGDDGGNTQSGSDLIYGGAGNDLVIADDDGIGVGANDTVYGDSGDDTIFGWDGADTLYGGADNDSIDGDGGADLIYGDDGLDTIDGGFAADTLYGDDGDNVGGDADQIYGSTNDDLIYGEGGNDTLVGDADFSLPNGADTIYGGSGNDLIYGDDPTSGDAGFADLLYGDEGNDTIWAGDGDDTIDGGAGNDTLEGQAGDDLIFGGNGMDFVDGSFGLDTIYGDDGDNVGGDADQIYGSTNDDLIYGEGGNDTLVGDADFSTPNGSDTIYGGSGDDLIFGDDSGMTADIGQADLLYGGSGDDTLDGGDGDDTLQGDAGADFFVYTFESDDGSGDSAGSGNDSFLDLGASDTLRLVDLDDLVDDIGDLNDTMIGDTGADVTVTFDNGDVLTLAGAGLLGDGNITGWAELASNVNVEVS